jgi:hypothetical protein
LRGVHAENLVFSNCSEIFASFNFLTLYNRPLDKQLLILFIVPWPFPRAAIQALNFSLSS